MTLKVEISLSYVLELMVLGENIFLISSARPMLLWTSKITLHVKKMQNFNIFEKPKRFDHWSLGVISFKLIDFIHNYQ